MHCASRKIIEYLYMVEKNTFCKEFPQNAKDFPGSFQEAVVRRFSVKEVFLRVSQNSQSLFNKVGVLQSAILFKKETPAQTFSCEFCEIFKNILLQNTSGQLLGFSLFQERFIITHFFL